MSRSKAKKLKAKSSPDKRCFLLILRRELRDMIWQFACTYDRALRVEDFQMMKALVHRPDIRGACDWSHDEHFTNLMWNSSEGGPTRVNKQITKEVLPIIITKNVLKPPIGWDGSEEMHYLWNVSPMQIRKETRQFSTRIAPLTDVVYWFIGSYVYSDGSPATRASPPLGIFQYHTSSVHSNKCVASQVVM